MGLFQWSRDAGPLTERLAQQQVQRGFAEGFEKGSSEYERMKMTEEAMRDLNLESMRILFKALDGKREVVVSILGKSDSGRRIISLDNNVNFVAGLPEIIRAYFDFEKLGIDLSKFGFGLNAFEIN